VTAAETFEPADFRDFKPGDRIHFVTKDNGYGGSGDHVWRTGTVTRVTEKTITVDCDSNRLGDRAVLRRATFSSRAPQRAVTAAPAALLAAQASGQESAMTGQPTYYLAEYEGADSALFSSLRLAQDYCDDLVRAEAQGRCWDWMPEDQGVHEQVWTDADSDRPTWATGGVVTALQVDAEAAVPAV
jgi:hypothetical protein